MLGGSFLIATRSFSRLKPGCPILSAGGSIEIAEALEDSVAKHMRADVTVGSFLSGGIDSTVVER